MSICVTIFLLTGISPSSPHLRQPQSRAPHAHQSSWRFPIPSCTVVYLDLRHPRGRRRNHPLPAHQSRQAHRSLSAASRPHFLAHVPQGSILRSLSTMGTMITAGVPCSTPSTSSRKSRQRLLPGNVEEVATRCKMVAALRATDEIAADPESVGRCFLRRKGRQLPSPTRLSAYMEET